MSDADEQHEEVMQKLSAALKLAQDTARRFAQSLPPEDREAFWSLVVEPHKNPLQPPTQMVVVETSFDDKPVIWLIVLGNKTLPNLDVSFRRMSEHEIGGLIFLTRYHPEVAGRIFFGSIDGSFSEFIADCQRIIRGVAELFTNNWQREYALQEVRQGTEAVRSELARIPDDTHRELVQKVQSLEASFERVEEIDQALSGLRQLIGQSREFQEWRVLVTDVADLKRQHVSRELFDTTVGRLDQRIEKFEKTVNKRIKDLDKAVNQRITDIYAGKQVHLRKSHLYLVLLATIISSVVAGITIYNFLRQLGFPFP